MAQLVERVICNDEVAGSNPARSTVHKKKRREAMATFEVCECGGKLVGEEAITPLTDENVMSWFRLWYDIEEAVKKGAKFCKRYNKPRSGG